MEEMKALVEPLPLVPEMCMRFSRSKSDGYLSSQPGMSTEDLVGGNSGCSHLISNPFAPLNHLGYSIFILVPARLSDGIYDRKIALQCIEGRNSILRCL